MADDHRRHIEPALNIAPSTGRLAHQHNYFQGITPQRRFPRAAAALPRNGLRQGV
jgi:hypothetical protein